uniref:Serine-threonine/tyrosine-protein kinase catalytic domain-containing protein n=1 Tax=Acrobeloides nanus TaxID=290746 RepID=A0A914CQ68_9BILA
MTIVFADIPEFAYLEISNGINIITQISNRTVLNETFIFNGSQAVVDFVDGNVVTQGVLIQYEALQHSIIEEVDQEFKRSVIWIAVAASLVVILAVTFTVSCYCYHERKREKRLDYIIDVLNNQKQLSPEEVEDLKEKRDEFTIFKKKLRIHYESPLGHGASSTIYNGFLYGQSPLTVLTKRLQTQRFQDCKVAIKLPSSNGQEEIEQLFREIDSMKRIGYHEHVISMLGICFLAEKAVIVFELAEKDLLAYILNLDYDSESGFGFWIPNPDSVFRIRIQIQNPDSESGFVFWILNPDSDFESGSRF